MTPNKRIAHRAAFARNDRAILDRLEKKSNQWSLYLPSIRNHAQYARTRQSIESSRIRRSCHEFPNLWVGTAKFWFWWFGANLGEIGGTSSGTAEANQIGSRKVALPRVVWTINLAFLGTSLAKSPANCVMSSKVANDKLLG